MKEETKKKMQGDLGVEIPCNCIYALPKAKEERVEELRKLRKIAKDFYKDYNAAHKSFPKLYLAHMSYVVSPFSSSPVL